MDGALIYFTIGNNDIIFHYAILTTLYLPGLNTSLKMHSILPLKISQT